MLNYRCLVLDHDDTVVRSEETVNYPSFLEALKVPDARGDRRAVRHVAKLCRHTYPAPL